MTIDVSSARAKLGRAHRHFEQLNDDVGAWQELEPYEFFHEHNPDWTEFVVGVEFTEPPPLLGWALGAGDI